MKRKLPIFVLPSSAAVSIPKMSAKEQKEFDDFNALENAGYQLECTAHEVVKNIESSEKSIWSKLGKLYIGNAISELKSFNGYVKIVKEDGFDYGTAVIHNDNPAYSLEIVMKDIELELGSKNFTLEDK